MKTKLLTICLFLLTSQVFAVDFVDIYKNAINKCSNGVTYIFNYDDGNGYIFHGEALDKFCLCKDFKNCSGKFPYWDGPRNFSIEDKFIERGKYFWFVAHRTSHLSVIQDVNFGVVVDDIMSATGHIYNGGKEENTYIITNLFDANKQSELNIRRFDILNRDIKFFENYYIKYYQTMYITSAGGLRWFNSKKNYQHEIIELLDSEHGTRNSEPTCDTVENIIKNYSSDLDKTNKEIIEATTNGVSKWWLAALKYHKKLTWCYSL